MIIDKSKNLDEVLKRDIKLREDDAMSCIKNTIAEELEDQGVRTIDAYCINKIIEGIPEDELNKLIAERM